MRIFKKSSDNDWDASEVDVYDKGEECKKQIFVKKPIFWCFLAVFFLLNVFLSFLLEPAYGSSDVMWKTFFHEEEIDTIFVGSSLCSASFDPKIFDEKLGVKSYNMGTPMQSIVQNITAVETALEEHEIKNVIIGVGFFIFQEEPHKPAALTFEKELARNKGGMDGFLESMEYVLGESAREQEQSINYWFPWVYNNEEYSISYIKKNLTTKKERLLAQMKGEAEELGLSDTKGYVPYHTYVNYDEIGDKNSYVMYQQNLRKEQLEEFDKLLSICKKAGVNVFVINTPHPDFDVRACREVYGTNTESLQKICEAYEVEYYDFSLVKPELFEKKDNYFADFEHLNYEGSQVFSEMLCEFMQKRQNGENMQMYFHTLEEYMNL